MNLINCFLLNSLNSYLLEHVVYVCLSIPPVASTLYRKNQKKWGRMQLVVITFKFDILELIV
jgi:hypothetical protein